MDFEIYQRFNDNNKRLVKSFDKAAKNQVIKYFRPGYSPDYELFHGTSSESAEKIIDEGFILDSYNGTHAMGNGVYLTPDRDIADIFSYRGEGKVLKVDVDLQSPAEYSGDALIGLRKFKDEFFEKIRAIFVANRGSYGCNDEEIRERVLEKLRDEDTHWLAKYRHQTPEECATYSVIGEETAKVFETLYSESLAESDYTSFFSFTDLSSSLMGMPEMPQWIITDTDEITGVSVV